MKTSTFGIGLTTLALLCSGLLVATSASGAHKVEPTAHHIHLANQMDADALGVIGDELISGCNAPGAQRNCQRALTALQGVAEQQGY